MATLESPRPLLLVHGLIGTLRDLLPVFDRSGVVAHAPDLLGYGELSHVAPQEIGLWQQVAHLVRWMDERGIERVQPVGHSVGGAVALLLAHTHPGRVSSVMNVEGNFSLADAFWSASVARMSARESEEMIAGFRTNPTGWLARSGIAPEPHHLAAAERLLANQPASTVHATARSVVEVTGNPSYENAIRSVFESAIPVHLIAGERSRSGWDVPDWAVAGAASETLLPGGHLTMVEDPERFVAVVAELSRKSPE